MLNLTLDLIKNQDDSEEEESAAPGTSAETSAAPAASTSAPPHSWNPGDKCVAVWSEDGK